MINRLLSYLGFCRHQRIGWPMLHKKEGITTVQCFDCARRIEYDWERMRLRKPARARLRELLVEVWNGE